MHSNGECDGDAQYSETESDESTGTWTGRYKHQAVADVTAQRRELERTQEWIVDEIFPAGAMHLLGGPSGVGKTTWLLQMLHEWEQGAKLFGEFQSNPVPWVYISCERSLRETAMTLNRLGYHAWEFEMYALEDLIQNKKTSLFDNPDFTKHILKRFPEAKLIVLEGLQAIMPDHSKSRSQNKQELLWAMEQRSVLAKGNRTVIASTHNPKVTAATGMSNVDERSKFLGSQGFIGSCSTMIGFEKHPKDPKLRSVTIMGRNYGDKKLQYSLDNHGRYVLEIAEGEAVETEEDAEFKLLMWATNTGRESFMVKDAAAYVMREGLGVSEAKLDRWLKAQAEDTNGALERERLGKAFRYWKRGTMPPKTGTP